MEKNKTPSRSIELVLKKYEEKRCLNSLYSLAAFARDLGLSASYLSRILKGERPLSIKLGIQIATLLGFSSKMTDEFLSLILADSGQESKVSKKLQETIERRVSNARQAPDLQTSVIINRENVQLLKKMMANFKSEFKELAEGADGKELYQLKIQLYAITTS